MTRSEAEILRLWRHDCESRGISQGVIGEYTRYLNEYRRDARPLIGSNTFDLSSFILERSERWAPATRQVARRAFRSFFAFAAEAGVMEANPALALKAIKQPLSPVRTPGETERLALVAACESARDAAIIDGLFGTGMRRAELSALRVGDVDIPAGTIFIPKAKSGKPRMAVMDERARRAIAAWIDERDERGPDHDWLWLTRSTARLKPAGVRMVVRRVSVRAGVVFSSHDARRAFAVEWLARGGSETGLMAVCGWSSPSMIARYVRERQTTLAIEEARRLFSK